MTHEIGHLVLNAALACWGWTNGECNVSNVKIPLYEKPSLQSSPAAQIARSTFETFRREEVEYEVSGLATFERKGDWYRIEKKTGEKLWLHLPSGQKLFDAAVKNKDPAFHFVPLETTVGQGMVSVEKGYETLLRKEDLKTPLPLPASFAEDFLERRASRYLKTHNLELPKAYVVISTPCTSTRISPTETRGSCAAAGEIAAYSAPNVASEKVLISKNTGHWRGRAAGGLAESRRTEQLYVFEIRDGWYRIQILFGPAEKRAKWVRKDDMPGIPLLLPTEKNTKHALEQFLRENNDVQAANAISLEPDPSFEATGHTKWSDAGVLWVEVEAREFSACDGIESGTPKALFKGWLPYVSEPGAKRVIGWYSRGC